MARNRRRPSKSELAKKYGVNGPRRTGLTADPGRPPPPPGYVDGGPRPPGWTPGTPFTPASRPKPPTRPIPRWDASDDHEVRVEKDKPKNSRGSRRRGRNQLRYDRLDAPERMNTNAGSDRYQVSYKDIQRAGKTVRLYESGEKMQIARPAGKLKKRAPVKELRKKVAQGGGYGYDRPEATLSRSVVPGAGTLRGPNAPPRFRRWDRRQRRARKRRQHPPGGWLPHQRPKYS